MFIMTNKKSKKVAKPVLVVEATPTSGPSKKTQRNRARRQRKRERMNEEITSSFGPNATRSGVMPNPADPRTDNKLYQLGNTIAGRQAALKILHPCMEECKAVVKIPDGAVSTSVVLERRDEYKISAPTSGTNNWDCLVLTLPFLNCRQVFVRWESSQTYTTQNLYYSILLAIENVGATDITYPNYRTVTISTGAKFETTCAMSSTLSPGTAQSDVAKISALIKSVRRTCCGVTTDLDASDLYNTGRVVSGQWTPDVATGIFTETDSTTEDLSSATDIYKFLVPAFQEQSIVSSDEFCRQAEAKSGSYMPIRPCCPDWPLTAVQEWRNICVTRAGTDVESFSPGLDNDLYLRGWAVGVSYWSGLNLEANLRLKVIEDLEVVPSPLSTYSPFSTPAYPDDARARAMIQEFCRKQPHDYPADFNEYGKMIPHLIGGVGNAVGDLGIPFLSPIGKAAGKLAQGPLGNLLGGLLDKLF